MRVLVAGVGGSIGSHVVKALGEKGHEVLTYDNFTSGNKMAVLFGVMIVADTADPVACGKTFREFKPDAVMLFAASIEVGESGIPSGRYFKPRKR